MTRGDIHWYLGPPTAAEKKIKKRPVIIVSNNSANSHPAYPYVSVIPITSNIDGIFSLEIDLAILLNKPSKAQPQAIFSCRKSDLSKKAITKLPWHLIFDLNKKLKLYLELID